jgi:hypothetical protein
MQSVDRDTTTFIKPPTVRYCAKCGSSFHFQLHRNWLVKTFLFFLPLRVYFCAKCQRSRYVIVKKKKTEIPEKTTNVLKSGNMVS